MAALPVGGLTSPPPATAALLERTDYAQLAAEVLAGQDLGRASARAVLSAPDVDLLRILDAAYTVRRRYFGNRVQLYYLVNAKSGLCPEDCGYCSQSRSANTGVARYPLLSRAELLEGAERAYRGGATTYCIVTSGTSPTPRELEYVVEAVREIKQRMPIRICCCLGSLDAHQAGRLAEAGVDRVNHNLNTSARYYSRVCSTHGFEDRRRTLDAVRSAGISLCSGGIVGMGETEDDVIDLAFSLREERVESIPVNFLHPIPGTAMAGFSHLNPRYCLKVLCLFRFANPASEIRIAGGRELHLRSLQAMGLYPANSLFISDYLTTPGQPPEEDLRMIQDLGFSVQEQSERSQPPL